MTDVELANALSLGAAVVSGGSLVIAYLGDRRARLAMQHSRRLAVMQLKKAIREQISATDAAIDKTSTRASHLRTRLESLADRKPPLNTEKEFADLVAELKSVEGAIVIHRKNAQIVLGALELVGHSEADEMGLTKQLDIVTTETVIASGDAWEVDLVEYERRVEDYESRP